MEIRHLRHLQAVVRHGTLTAAASELGIAQSALSQSIAKLEAELGVRLFTRTRSGVVLTVAGRDFIDDSRDGLALIDEASERARDHATGKAARIVIGFVTLSQFRLLPEVLRTLSARMPRVDVQLVEMKTLEQPDALRANKIDIGLVHSPLMVGARVRERVIAREELVAAVPSDFPETADRHVSLAQLAAYNFISYPAADFPALRSDLEDAFRASGAHLHVSKELARTFTILACISAGYGVSLLPKAVVGVAFKGVKYIDVAMPDRRRLPYVTMSVLWRASARPTATDHLVELLVANPADDEAEGLRAEQRNSE